MEQGRKVCGRQDGDGYASSSIGIDAGSRTKGKESCCGCAVSPFASSSIPLASSEGLGDRGRFTCFLEMVKRAITLPVFFFLIKFGGIQDAEILKVAPVLFLCQGI